MLRDRSRAVGRDIPVVVKKPKKKLVQEARPRQGLRSVGTVTSSLLERYPPELVRPEKPKLKSWLDTDGADIQVTDAVPCAPRSAPVTVVEAKTPQPPARRRPVEIPVERFLDDLDEILDEGRGHQAQGTKPKPAAARIGRSSASTREPEPKIFISHNAEDASAVDAVGNALAFLENLESEVGPVEEVGVIRERLEELEKLRREIEELRSTETTRQVKLRQRAVRLAAGIPDVNPAAVDAITRLLMDEREGTCKPPVKTAHLLAIICRLHEEHRPFPEREAVAARIGASRATVESALSHRTAEGYISMRVETREGHVNPDKRPSIVREKYYDPAEKLLAAYRNPYLWVRHKHARTL